MVGRWVRWKSGWDLRKGGECGRPQKNLRDAQVQTCICTFLYRTPPAQTPTCRHSVSAHPLASLVFSAQSVALTLASPGQTPAYTHPTLADPNMSSAAAPSMMSSIKLASDGSIEIVNQLLLPYGPPSSQSSSSQADPYSALLLAMSSFGRRSRPSSRPLRPSSP